MADKGTFIPKNPQKYLGRKSITFRSSWELTAMNFFDQNGSILGWMSESLPTKTLHESGIAYRNPFTNRQTIYVPDFFVVYVDKNNKQHAEVIEVKPLDEVPTMFGGPRGQMSKLKEARRILNAAKFIAAVQHCAKHGWFFRVMTEKDLFKRRK
jgi:hypothetical protein